MEELNVAELKTAHPDEYGSTLAVPNFKALGARLGKRMAPVATAIKKLTPSQIAEFQKSGSVTVEGETLSSEEVPYLEAYCNDAHLICILLQLYRTMNCLLVIVSGNQVDFFLSVSSMIAHHWVCCSSVSLVAVTDSTGVASSRCSENLLHARVVCMPPFSQFGAPWWDSRSPRPPQHEHSCALHLCLC